MKNFFEKNKKEILAVFFLLIIGSFFRFWKLGTFQYFSYDQARDFIIIKRIIVDRKLTLVGPTVSIAPGVFLPPFYYYSLIPFLILFKFHILGPDIYTALFGVGSILVFYFLAKDFFGKVPAFISSFVFALNPYLIQSSRHAWNPNTLPFFILLFALSFERYFFREKRIYLPLAAFCLSWSIGLHLTAIVFLPFLVFLFIKEIKKFGFNRKIFFSLFLFIITFLPLVMFEVRHGFQVFHSGLSFLGNQSKGGSFFIRFFQMLTDLIKVPVVLFSGLFQEQNLTVRPSHISAFSEINIIPVDIFSLIKFCLTVLLILLTFFSLLKLKGKSKELKLIFLFIFFGFLIRLFFPINSFYFYYYLTLFPFLFLLFTALPYYLLRTRSNFLKIFTVSLIGIFSILPLIPNGLKADIRPEKYFISAAEIIANDFPKNKKVAITSSVADSSRWEKNGLEYRYFLEAFYKLPLGEWDEKGYKEAEVLYLIDEGNLPDPLKLGGMEMEAFSPKKIIAKWETKNRQKIYKMIR